VLTDDPTRSSLLDLAVELACSPHHLSRVFHEQTGTTLSAYRTQLRANLALEHLTGVTGSATLADVAAQCGFADHAHLTRTVRRHLGTTPAALRTLLT